MSEATRDVRTVATGVLCLGIGFGRWWTYFDLVGDRLPRASSGGVSAWMFSHLPTTLTIAAAPALFAAAGGALVLGALHPAPWLLALGLVGLLAATWWVAFLRLLGGPSPAP